MFAAGDNKTHGRLRRPVAGAFAMTSVIQFEPFVDKNMKMFLSRIQELFIEPKKPCDIHNWAQYCEFFSLHYCIYSPGKVVDWR